MMCGDTELLDACVLSFIIHSLDSSYSLDLSDVVIVDNIPVALPLAPTQKVISKNPHLANISLPIVDGSSVTLLLENDYAEAHRCTESRFSPSPFESPDAVLTQFGWMLRGPKLSEINDVQDF